MRQNVAYGLRGASLAARARSRRAWTRCSRSCTWSAFADRLPRQLSGGQQQRIALARCLAIDPKILLLDEPFGALDKNLRLDMQIEVKRLQRDYGITTILVTHDQEEALSMADRIAVMNRGRIEQVASPTEIYDQPATLFVNQFVGTTNLLAGQDRRQRCRRHRRGACRWSAARARQPELTRRHGSRRVGAAGAIAACRAKVDRDGFPARSRW